MNCKHSVDFIITRRQLSSVFAGILFILFFSFIGGYLAHIYVVSQRDYLVTNVNFGITGQKNNESVGAHIVQGFIDKKESLHSAELTGFGTYKKACNFIEELDKKGFSLILNEHKSCTPQGSDIVWYQVVTDLYEDKNELVTLVNQVRQHKRLNDVRFVTLQG